MTVIQGVAGPFTLVATCYVPKCLNDADLTDSGGPICRKHHIAKRIYDIRQAGYYRTPQSWTAKELADEAAVRAEIAALEAAETA